MRIPRLWPTVLMLTLVVFLFGCGSTAQLDEQGSPGQTPKSNIKAVSLGAVDGGLVSMAAAVAQTDPSPTVTYTVTATQTGTGPGIVTDTGTKVITVTNTGTGTTTTTGAVVQTDTQTASTTRTYSAVETLTASFTGTRTGTLTSSAAKTVTKTAMGTASWAGTYLGTGTATGTKNFTATLTGTTTLSGILSITATGTQTKTATKTVSGTAIGSGTKTTTQTYTAHPTVTTTTSATGTTTDTMTLTKNGTVVVTVVGTSTATSANPCYGSWAFCDNFESGNASRWTVQQGNQSDFSVASDPSRVYLESSSAASTWHVAQAGTTWIGQTIEAKMKAVSFSSSAASMALFGRYEKNWLGDCAYYLSLRGDGKVALGKRLNGVDSVLGAPVSSGIVAGTWYTLKLDIQGSTIDAYLNGSKVLSQTDSTCEVGSVGVASFGASFEADDVRVTAPTTNTCVQNWRSSACADYCTGQTQSDRIGCQAVLDCYASNGCGPASCGGQDDVCGVNYPRLNTWGTASKIVADQVYKCMGCAGSVSCGGARKADWTMCADGSPCTWNDSCQNGVCQPGTATTCYALDQCHDVGTCHEVTGACSTPTKADNTACDDENGHTAGDICTAGQCQGTQACTQVASVAAGISHTCVVRSDGSLWCWGANGSGQLGTGGTDASAVAVQVGPTIWRWSAVTGGEEYTCAIRIDGTLWCWGKNDSGQLGNDSLISAASPVPVAGVGWTAVQAGKRHTCGVRNDGALLCWGDNTFGALGDGTYDLRQSPVEVPQRGWISVAAGNHHTCGVKDDHTIWCWGENSEGRLGNGTTQASPLPVQASGAGWVSVSAGGSHTCATKLDGSLWCWGAGLAGQLGLGTTLDQPSPNQVGTAAWTAVALGAAYTCAVQANGTLWCWGANEDRQLGDGTSAGRTSPVRIPGQAWTTLAADATHTCGQRQDGSLWCWGANPNGELGDGTTGNYQASPKQIVGALCSQVPICGNGGALEQGEECDDGNNTNGDGCSFDCKAERCFGVVCEGSDACHGVCDPATGECTDEAKLDGTSCNDQNACTRTDKCFSGACIGGNKVTCPDTDQCHPVGSCDTESGSCAYPVIENVDCAITLRMDGTVAKDGKLIAIFGYNSIATKPVHPSENRVTIEGSSVTVNPFPPAYLLPGNHPGAFLGTFSPGQEIAWWVDGHSISASGNNPTRQVITDGNGTKVDIGGGITVPIAPNTEPYETPAQDPGSQPEPTHGGAFNGTLTGQLTTSPTGAAVYTLPISIPPGIAGMAPNLALVYNSQAGDGIAGQGWELSGLSKIQRCPKTRAQDGIASPVRMDANTVDTGTDGLCLDGSRLFSMAGGSSVIWYKSEFDDQSETITHSWDQPGSSGHFEVVTKSGEKRFYGLTDQSRVLFPKEDEHGVVTPTDLVPAIWALERVEDVWGNFFEITYNEGKNTATDQGDFQSRGLIVTEIRYTGHVDADGVASTSPFAKITLHYESRTDVRNTRFRDSVLPMNTRLKDITTARGVYSLVYAAEDKMLPSRLSEIHYCAKGDGQGEAPCVEPLTFGWMGGDYHWEDSFAPESGSQDPAPATNFALPTETPGPGTQLVDLDGDGRLDYMQSRWSGIGHTWRNTGSGWEQKDAWAPPSYLSDWNGASWNSALADVDGDGMVDFLALDGSGAHNYACPNNDYSSCSAFPEWYCPPPCQDDTSRTVQVFLNRMQQGAGWLPDPVRSRTEDVIAGLRRASFPPNHTYLEPQWNRADLTGDVHFRTHLGDIDGDGRAELIHFGQYDQGVGCCAVYAYRVDVLRSTDSGWVAADPSEFLVNTDNAYRLAGIRDINRDGLVDLVTDDPTVFYLNVGPAGGDFGTRWRRTVSGPATPWPASSPPDLVNYGDVDGDGQLEVLGQTWDKSSGYCCWEYQQLLDVATKMTFSSGQGWSVAGPSGYQAAIDAFNFPSSKMQLYNKLPQDQMLGNLASGRFSMVDLNSDGLADLVVTHEGGGQALINSGTTWVDLNGKTDKGNCPGDPGQHGYDFYPCDVGANPVPQAYDPWHIGKLTLYKPIYTEPEPPTVEIGPFDAFVDLDGDGVTDRIQTAKGIWVRKRAWLNKFQPPVIKDFPNGLAKPTALTYSVITTANAVASGVYVDNHARKPGTRHATAPVRVVASVAVDNGVGSNNSMTYQYVNLRTSASGRGPVGFSSVIATDHASGVVTTTEYSQTYPFTGRPVKVTRSNQGPLTTTTTQYCYWVTREATSPTCGDLTDEASIGPGKSVFIYPGNITDVSYLRTTNATLPETATETVVSTTQYTYDKRGNPTNTTVTTTSGGSSQCSGPTGSGGDSQGTNPVSCRETYQQETANDYGSDGSWEQLRGKPKEVVSTVRKLAPQDGTPSVVHKTDMVYRQDGTVALLKKIVEPGTQAPLEVHTVFDYDQYGNLTTTTECADDFSDCGPTGPGDTEHPLYRTTQTSYRATDFHPPSPAGAHDPTGTNVISTLSYGDGRFPVKTTNALGHTQYTAYNPLFGAVVQTTGPNAVYTCLSYDAFGSKIAETARCGSAQPATTTTQRYRTGNSMSEFNEKVVTVTISPTGSLAAPASSSSYAYSDALGRVLRTLTHSFDGGFGQTRTLYDVRGRVSKVSTPAPVADSELWTETHYDFLGRPDLVTQDLGMIDGTSKGAKSRQVSTATIYQGSSITTRSSAGEVVHSRTESKNGLGKVVSITDAAGSTIYYSYDLEGRLTDTHPISPTSTGVHIHYDLLGRKDAGTDPDLGSWTYKYNGFGDLIEQKDAKNSVTRLTYDKLGRMVTKTYEAGTSNAVTAEWVYDRAAGAGIGKLAAAISPPKDLLKGECPAVPYVTQTSGKRAGRWYSYDALGNVQTANECTDGDTFSTEYMYDSLGRQSVVRYPVVNGSRLSVRYNYTSLGFLQYVSDASNGKVYWQALAMNVLGQVTREQARNGVETVSKRNPVTGWLLEHSATAKADGDNLIQGMKYAFDPFGNLLTRTRSEPRDIGDSQETFTHDVLDRLLTSTGTTDGHSSTESYSYDAVGNLTQKAGKTLSYSGCAHGGGLHAVCSVAGGQAYSYDANGNMTSGNGRTVEYTAFNKVNHIEGRLSAPGGASPTVDFAYGPDGDRVVQRVGTTAGDETARTVYVGLGATGKSWYERTQTRLGTEHVHFIYAGGAHQGNALALRVMTDKGDQGWSDNTRYNHFDHLGSVTATSDETGQIIRPTTPSSSDTTVMGFDAWGARRNADGTPSTVAYWASQPGHREYTGHEAISEVGLVNMNGRVYDPELGRFLSADPSVQFMADLQSYNRYSYVKNNPLKYTDPTGYMPWYATPILGTVQSMFGGGYKGFAEGVTTVAMVAACGASYGVACGVFAALRVAQAVEMDGASFGQAVLSTGVTVLASQYGAGMTAGQQGGLTIITGAIAAGVSSSMSRAAAGADPLDGPTFLAAAGSGALVAALGYAAQLSSAMSQSSAAQQGDGDEGFDDLRRTKAQLTKARLARLQVLQANASSANTTSSSYGLLPIDVVGGTEEMRTEAMNALTQDLATPRGQDMAKEFMSRLDSNGSVEHVRVYVDADSGLGTYSVRGGNVMVLQPGDLLSSYSGREGLGFYGYNRIFAHEMGHMAFGNNSLPELTNIKINENAIMEQLGYTNDRILY